MHKTFYAGRHGWRDEQRADGTVVWTSPTGHTYTTKPGGSLFFPQLAIPSAELAAPTCTPPPQENRGLMMPTRRRTRAEDRMHRIAYERELNEQRYARDYAAAPF